MTGQERNLVPIQEAPREAAGVQVLPPPAPMDADVPTAFSDDFKNLLRALFARKWMFLAIVALAFAVGLVWTRIAVPTFTATATVVIDPRKQVVISSPEVLSDLEADSSVIDTQTQLIQSRAVVGKVVDRLALPLEVQSSSSKALSARAWALFTGSLPTWAPSEKATVSRDQLIDSLIGRLEVQRIGLTSALRLSFTDPDPEFSARFANALAGEYLDYQLDMKRQANKDANQWLADRVADLKQQFEAAEAKVDRYRSNAGLLVANGTTSTESQLTNLDVGLNEARQALSDAQAKLTSYRTALQRSGPAEAAKIVASASMQQLRNRFSELVGQRAQLSPTLGPVHPQMVELRRQIEGVQEQMNAEARRTLDELQDAVSVANQRVSGMLSIRDSSRQRLASDNAASLELAQLQTNAQSLRTMYENMLTRLQQTTAQETLGTVNATIISQAVPPTSPTTPRANLILGSAGIVGVALAGLAVLLTNLFDNSLKSPRELERRTRLPVLALVPRVGWKDLRVSGRRISISEAVAAKPMSMFAECFRTARVAVQRVLPSRKPVVLQFTSGSFGEGKTTCSIAFAQAAAADGRRVLLIDADVRRRSLTQNLHIHASAGLMEVLRGTVESSAAILPGPSPRHPHVLPLSETDPGPHDRFSGTALETLLKQLKKDFDVIVIDSAPVLAVAESLNIAMRADAVILVAKWYSSPTESVLRSLEELKRVDARVIGFLLTQVDVRRVSDQTYGRGHYSALMRYYER
jgi:capsular exopolysaccharide synthesis family protein